MHSHVCAVARRLSLRALAVSHSCAQGRKAPWLLCDPCKRLQYAAGVSFAARYNQVHGTANTVQQVSIGPTGWTHRVATSGWPLAVMMMHG